MAATALAAASAVFWLESYSRGWITVENVRNSARHAGRRLDAGRFGGSWYGAVVQHWRDLKNMAIAAEDEAAIEAIDETAGWPE